MQEVNLEAEHSSEFRHEQAGTSDTQLSVPFIFI